MTSNGTHRKNTHDELSISTINQKVVEAEYAVRGAIPIKAADYNKQLAEGGTDLPFKKILACNIGIYKDT